MFRLSCGLLRLYSQYNRVASTRSPNVNERRSANTVERRPTPEPATFIEDPIALQVPHAYEDHDRDLHDLAVTVPPAIVWKPNTKEPTVESIPDAAHSPKASNLTNIPSTTQTTLATSATLTLRISNIKDETTEDNFKTYFADRNLQLSDDHGPIIFIMEEGNGKKRTTASLNNGETFRRAISLTRAERKLDDSVLEFDSKFLGFTAFSEGTEVEYVLLPSTSKPIFLFYHSIIALHGINGHAFTTFEYREEDYSFMWLRDALPKRMPKARIMVYGYDANVVSDASVGRIRTYAETFMQKLRLIRKVPFLRLFEMERIELQLCLGYQTPFNSYWTCIGRVTHQTGTRSSRIHQHYLTSRYYQALILPNAEGVLDSIVNSVRGVIFMATPHQGIKGVDNPTFVKNFFGVSGVHFRSDLIAEQEAKTMVLFDLTNDFKELIARKQIPIRTLYETRKTRVGDSGLVGVRAYYLRTRNQLSV